MGTIREGAGAGIGAGVWRAPGRVNLIGEHTDYNDGLVLPIALPHAARATVRARQDGVLRLYSEQSQGPAVELDVRALTPGGVDGWVRYPAAVVWTLREAGYPVGGADVRIDSDVPTGAGLSSSAAIECAVAAAFNDLHGLGLDSPEMARLAQHAENTFVGVPCGIMDQMASLCAQPGAALFLDTRDLSIRHVPFDIESAGLRLLVIDTRVKHNLADGEYARLRAACQHACAVLGLETLRDVNPQDLLGVLARLPRALVPMVRHVVSENVRVEQAVALLEGGDLRGLGPVLTAGHVSLRDDYDVSCAETDLAVNAAVEAGALGARMTGGGFGGSVIALVDSNIALTVAGTVKKAFHQARRRTPRIFAAVASAGARRIS
ncbi:galactokinase [Streptomyces sp. HNM0663]|uniref:Galactokinase n=1 Tax=Streptomyces chengmaiensis TaxID=3040919 RepID=A0ABT6HX74_9ACTN|nr:galactokinase [Streptomyces chengmaiensis]MDH2393299.1 galactokinase [Streptomyces chengmaiensis]